MKWTNPLKEKNTKVYSTRIDNMNSPVSTRCHYQVNLPTKNTPDPNEFTGKLFPIFGEII